MSDTVAIPAEKAAEATQYASTISYGTFKKAVIALHEQGKEGAEEGDFHVLNRGIQLLNELGALFPAHAARLADEPDFLS